MPPNPLLLLSPLGTIGQFPCRIPMRALLTAIMTTLAMKSSIQSASSSLTASLSKSFLFAFYNNRKKDKTSNNGVLSKEYWMKDESSKECFSCGKTFNTFRRKHHCRICGQIFCSSCTLLIDGDRFGCHAKMRDNHNGTDLHDPVAATDNRQQQNAVYLLNDDDVQSVMTSGEDSKLFSFYTPTTTEDAMRATKQGWIAWKSHSIRKTIGLCIEQDEPRSPSSP
ncbi:CNT_HP2_G0018480.mRNA.1.CDS.1 [Saccharomyces cerevisiae]|nr:CNT_HP2_G0018480.mRNA.1.CDS.1 [Saccharomyces cerevisiae]CAI6538503.1 CNT_HP2_G0018480.mRNA.1.CDS.1 [Saccharomyces cerevisiae]